MCEEEGITQRNKDLWQSGVNGLCLATKSKKNIMLYNVYKSIEIYIRTKDI